MSSTRKRKTTAKDTSAVSSVQPPTTNTPSDLALDPLPLIAAPTLLQQQPLQQQQPQQQPLNPPLVPITIPIQMNLPLPLPPAPRNQITSAAAKNVPAFLNKLYNMVSDPSSDLIHWSDDGQAFIVEKHEEFAQKCLPRFFKHNNFSSFVRQLNMYGFHKVPHLQQGALIESEAGECWEFANPHFQRNQPDLLCLVTRKRGTVVSSSKEKDDDDEVSTAATTTQTRNGKKDGEKGAIVDVNAVVNEISAIKRHQITISTDLKTIQRENQALWNETIVMREQYRRQQDTIDKIVRFLATVFEARNKTGGSVAGSGVATVPAPAAATPANGGAGAGALDFLGLLAGTGGVMPAGNGVGAGVGVGSGDVLVGNKKRKLLTSGGEAGVVGANTGAGAGNGILFDDAEFLNFDSFAGTGAGAGGASTSNAPTSGKRMPSLPSNYANLEFMDDKIFELIQSPPFESPVHTPPPINATLPGGGAAAASSLTAHDRSNATQAKLVDVAKKAERIQEEIDLLDDHLLSASALLGIDELDSLNMEELFGSASSNGIGSGVGGGVGNAGAVSGSIGSLNGSMGSLNGNGGGVSNGIGYGSGGGQLQEIGEDDDWL